MERQVTDRINDSIYATVKETLLEATHLETDFMNSGKKRALSGPIDVLIFQMDESGQVESYSKTHLSTFASRNIFKDSIIHRIMTQQSFTKLVTQFVKR